MGGLGRLFTRIIPIIMLVCFVCLGITHAFNQIGTENKTYLTTETINVGTQENPNNITYYNLDVISYVNNIKVDILKEATDKVIDTDTFTRNFDSFNAIWNDGYQIGDVSNTIANAIILAINILTTGINIILIPIRIICGLLLTAMSIIGINITTSGIITNSLKTLLNSLAIPLIQPTTDKGDITIIANTTWHFNNTIDTYYYTWYENQIIFYVQYSENATYECISLEWTDLKGLAVKTNNNVWITLYKNGIWYNDYYKNIYIASTTLNENYQNNIRNWLLTCATEITQNRQIESTTVENETKSYIRYAI